MKKLSYVRLLAVSCSLAVFAAALGCGSKSTPAAPTPVTPVPVVVTPKLTGTPEATSPLAAEQMTSSTIPLTVKNAPAAGAVTDVKYHFEWSESDQFPANSLTGTSTDSGGTDPTEDGGGTTTFSITRTLRPNFKYYWHAKAISGNAGETEYSPTESFKTSGKGFRNGLDIYDPLTDGSTFATRRLGGSLIGDGWRSNSMNDALDYDIPTCDNCTVEFDVTNFGAGEGASAMVDVKWFSMGDAPSMNAGFTPFRDSPWKMHLEQRSDGDGTGMQLIWRNGATDADTNGDPELGDHRGKFLFGGPDFGHSGDKKVWHFTITWTPTSYKVYVNELGQPLRQWFPGAGDSGVFSRPYRPGNMRVELGCAPRGESMVGAIYRNFRLTQN